MDAFEIGTFILDVVLIQWLFLAKMDFANISRLIKLLEIKLLKVYIFYKKCNKSERRQFHYNFYYENSVFK